MPQLSAEAVQPVVGPGFVELEKQWTQKVSLRPTHADLFHVA